jgi:hypothetical protein
MVSELGRSIQDCASLLWKFLYGGIIARAVAALGAQWKILEVLPKCMARCLRIHGRFIWKSLLAQNWPTTVVSSLRLFFSMQALLKKRAACVDTQIWQKLTQVRQVGQTGSPGRSDRGAL